MNNFILALSLFAPLSPTIFAQPLVIISLIFIIVKRYKLYILNEYLGFKIISTACFSFGIINSFAMEPSVLIRFIPLLYLIWFYPYFDKEELNASFLKKFSLGIIFMMIASQFLLAFQEPIVTAFRESFYPIKADVWDERAYFFELSTNALTIFRGFRLGGFWYNPNMYASNLFLVYVVFYSASKYLLSIPNKLKKDWRNNIYYCFFFCFFKLIK